MESMATSRDWRWAWLGTGLVLGLAASALWPHAPAHASATDRQDNFAICTGFLDPEIEAVFVLDPLEGSITGMAISPATGVFAASYRHDVRADLGVTNPAQAKFLMLTGVARFKRTAGAARPGESVLYIADVASGKLAAYAVPYSQQALINGTPTPPLPLKLLQVVPFRQTTVRQ
jgi:hypothetical protein